MSTSRQALTNSSQANAFCRCSIQDQGKLSNGMRSEVPLRQNPAKVSFEICQSEGYMISCRQTHCLSPNICLIHKAVKHVFDCLNGLHIALE